MRLFKNGAPDSDAEASLPERRGLLGSASLGDAEEQRISATESIDQHG